MRLLVTGITGYVGSALVPLLQADGHTVRGYARSASRVEQARVRPDELVLGDAVAGSGLDEALEGIDTAYYLIHSMETAAVGAFEDAERRSAEQFAAAAAAAGVRRVVYLGGLVPAGVQPSRHLASRMAVEEAMLDAVPDSIAFRASIVIGARSRSFRFLVRLVERLPVLPLPGWRDNRTRPIDGRDVLEFLVRAADRPGVGGRSWDIGGPDVVTYGELVERIADAMLVPRPRLMLGLTMTPIASVVASAVAGEDLGLIGPLMESLEHDLLPRAEDAAGAFGVRLHAFDAAVERALRDWEREERLAAR